MSGLVSAYRRCTTAQLASDRVVHSDPGISGGTPVFVGTRVPVQNLFDYMAAGDGLEIFLDAFPTVSREQVIAVLEISSGIFGEGAKQVVSRAGLGIVVIHARTNRVEDLRPLAEGLVEVLERVQPGEMHRVGV